MFVEVIVSTRVGPSVLFTKSKTMPNGVQVDNGQIHLKVGCFRVWNDILRKRFAPTYAYGGGELCLEARTLLV